MKVKELIKELEKSNQENEVWIDIPYWSVEQNEYTVMEDRLNKVSEVGEIVILLGRLDG